LSKCITAKKGLKDGPSICEIAPKIIPALRQQEKVLRERNQALQEEQERQARQIKELETERLRQESLLQEKGAQIKVLEDENVALVALLGNLKTQLSQVSLRFWFVLGLGTIVAVTLYRRWRREVEARDIAEYRMRLLEVPDCAQCVICQVPGEEPRDQLLEPCQHVCVCRSCVEELMEDGGLPFRCPVCRSWVLGTRRVFMA